MNDNTPLDDRGDAGNPFELDVPQLDMSVVVLYSTLALILTGIWYGTWLLDEARQAMLIGTGVGLLIGGWYCGLRLRRFDVRTWRWRNTTKQPHYGPNTYLLITLTGVVGLIAGRFIMHITSQALQFGFMGGIFSMVGAIFAGSTIEGMRHLWYHRQRKRTKR